MQVTKKFAEKGLIRYLGRAHSKNRSPSKAASELVNVFTGFRKLSQSQHVGQAKVYI